jgi:hypothetical protein
MDSASSLAYPGSRVLAGWWRQLQPHRPAALWVGSLFVHRVEALVESIEPRPLDGLALQILEALAVDQPTSQAHGHGPDRLPSRLHLPPPAVRRLLTALAAQDLVRACEPGCWCLSERGRVVLAARADHAPRRERRTFPFIERLTPAGRRLAMPHYLPLAECPAVAWEVDEAHRFDATVLTECVAQPEAWKIQHAFPTGANRLLVPAEGDANRTWERVIVDRPQRVALALVSSAAEPALLGFAAEAAGWNLHADAPVLRLSATVRAVLPELTVPPAGWQEAWRLWCRQRHLPQSEADACRLNLDGIHLDVHATESFEHRLRQSKTDLLREEPGLLAGDGYLRAAALLRLQANTGS